MHRVNPIFVADSETKLIPNSLIRPRRDIYPLCNNDEMAILGTLLRNGNAAKSTQQSKEWISQKTTIKYKKHTMYKNRNILTQA